MFQLDNEEYFVDNPSECLESGAFGSQGQQRQWSLLPRSITGVRHVSLSSVIESGRSLASRVQALMSDETGQGASIRLLPASFDKHEDNTKLLENIATAFDRQENINKAHAQLTKINYMVNVTNYFKHKNVEQAVREGQKQLNRMHSKIREQADTIGNLNDSVVNLEVDIKCTQDTCGRLDTSLKSQQELLNTSLRENRETLEKQNSILVQQQAMVQQLVRQRVRHDFMVDAALVGSAIYLTNTILINYPLEILLKIVPRTRLRKWMHQSVKLLLIFRLVTVLKAMSVKCGIHNSVGSVLPYLREGWNLVSSQMSNMITNLKEDKAVEEIERKQSPTAFSVC